MQWRMRSVVIVLFAVWTSLAVADEPIIQYGERFHPTLGYGGMVVSQDALASSIGAHILEKGGNAVDAAVATGFALAVTLPQAGNIGGGGFMLIHLAEQNRTLAVDYREMAPAAAHRELFVGESGRVDEDKARFSAQATGVPGTVAGLLHVQGKYGRLPRAQVLAPAVQLAREGFIVDHSLSYALARSAKRLASHPAARDYFLPGGKAPAPGSVLRQPDLAQTLATIARQGADGFYKGEVAEKIVAEMERTGGLITKQDLANYRVVERQPVTGEYRGFRIASMPPPSSGGVHLVQMLNILEGWDLAELGHNSAAYLHRVIEAMRRAYADRSQYLGDPDFYPVPADRLVAKDYGNRLREGIDLDAATPSSQVAPSLDVPGESRETTHFAAWDQEGNVVSNTYTLNFSFGNGMAVTGAGFLLNNEMNDFSAKPGVPNAYGLIGGEANAIEPGKRPLSSMTPTLVFKGDRPVMATGSPGGSRIITAVLQMVLNSVDFDMNLAEATAAPRVHHQWLPDKVMVEDGISADTRRALKAMGHEFGTNHWSIGRSQSLKRRGDVFLGVSDFRWPGGAAVPARPYP